MQHNFGVVRDPDACLRSAPRGRNDDELFSHAMGQPPATASDDSRPRTLPKAGTGRFAGRQPPNEVNTECTQAAVVWLPGTSIGTAGDRGSHEVPLGRTPRSLRRRCSSISAPNGPVTVRKMLDRLPAVVGFLGGARESLRPVTSSVLGHTEVPPPGGP